MEKLLIILPTYNEIENLENMVRKLMGLSDQIQVLIIEDNSPDGTGKVADQMTEEFSRVNVIHRKGKLGLGSAYITGFKWALEKTDINYIMEMDCDFSHNPDYVLDMAHHVMEGKCDLIIGSRYVKGGGVKNWPFSRYLLSYCASIYARIISGLPIHDTTAGFKCFHRKVLENINLDMIRSDGYSFQIEMHYAVWKKKFRIKEFPIVFVDRENGISKMSKKIIWEAIWLVWKLRWMKF